MSRYFGYETILLHKMVNFHFHMVEIPFQVYHFVFLRNPKFGFILFKYANSYQARAYFCAKFGDPTIDEMLRP